MIYCLKVSSVSTISALLEWLQMMKDLITLRRSTSSARDRHKFVCLFNLLERVLILVPNLNLNEYNWKL